MTHFSDRESRFSSVLLWLLCTLTIGLIVGIMFWMRYHYPVTTPDAVSENQLILDSVDLDTPPSPITDKPLAKQDRTPASQDDSSLAFEQLKKEWTSAPAPALSEKLQTSIMENQALRLRDYAYRLEQLHHNITATIATQKQLHKILSDNKVSEQDLPDNLIQLSRMNLTLAQNYTVPKTVDASSCVLEKITLDTKILFESGKYRLHPQGESALMAYKKQLLDILQNHNKALLRIDGHTDNIPLKNQKNDFLNNRWLASMRALAVVAFLETQGFPKDRLAIMSFGEYAPVGQEKALNRRIELNVLCQ